MLEYKFCSLYLFAFTLQGPPGAQGSTGLPGPAGLPGAVVGVKLKKFVCVCARVCGFFSLKYIYFFSEGSAGSPRTVGAGGEFVFLKWLPLLRGAVKMFGSLRHS